MRWQRDVTLGRRPRLGTRAITTLRSNELRILQAFTDHAAERLDKASLVVVLAFVEPKRLLIAISEQMKRLDVYIRPFEGAFQKRPEVFQPVRMDLALAVPLQVAIHLEFGRAHA